MARSEAQRRADKAYAERKKDAISNQYKSISCFMPREEAEEFKALCLANGTTQNKFLLESIRDFVSRCKNGG